MNRKAESSELLSDSLVYTIFLIIFAVLMILYTLLGANQAKAIANLNSKEIVRQINSAEPGTEIELNVQTATEIAVKNEVAPPFSEIFTFDNAANEVCVKLSKGKKTCYKYFNDVDVLPDSERIKFGLGSDGQNKLVLKIIERQR